MRMITMNGIKWYVVRVPPTSGYLIDRSNTLTLGTTDPVTRCVYISDQLKGNIEKRVIAHELGHVACFSYGLIGQIHAYSYPEHWIDMEELICNFVADYGAYIWDITKDLTDVHRYLERMVS